MKPEYYQSDTINNYGLISVIQKVSDPFQNITPDAIIVQFWEEFFMGYFVESFTEIK